MSAPAPPPHLAPNIVLTGFMGTGETTIGRLLADRLGRTFVDTDDIIEERHGPIPAIFERLGEAAFRDMEREVAAVLGAATGMVVATGGGLMLDDDAASSLGATGRVFCLAADVDALAERLIAEADHRPMLAGDDVAARIGALLDQRMAGYARFEQIPTTGRTPDDVADDIIGRLSPQH